MRDRAGDHEHNRELPGAPFATRKPARDPEQGEPEGEGERARCLRPAGREHRLDDPASRRDLRQERREHAHEADERGCKGNGDG